MRCLLFLPLLAAAAWTQTAYVTNQNSDTLSVIDLRDGRVTATLGIGLAPAGVAAAPDGARFYVVNPNSNTMAIFGATAAGGVFQGTVGVGQNPVGIAISPNGQRIFVANAMSASVTVLNPATFATLANVRVGFTPVAVAVRPDSSRAYSANASSDTVSVINTANNAIVATVPVGSAPVALAVTSNGASAYVANAGSNSLTQIDLDTNRVVGTIELDRTPAGLAIARDGTVYVSSYGSASVIVVDGASNTVRRIIDLPPCEGGFCSALGVAVSDDGKSVYVTNTASNTLFTVDTDRREVVRTTVVGAGPRAVTLRPVQGGN